MKKLSLTILVIVLTGALTSCALGGANLDDCTDLVGRYRATDFSFTSVDGTLSESFEGGVLEFGFEEGVFNSSFGAVGYDPLRLKGEPFTATSETLTLSEPFISRVEPGAQTFECGVAGGDTLILRGGGIGFDFNDDGMFEDAIFEGTFNKV